MILSCDAKKKNCFPVICPDHKYDLNETFANVHLKLFIDAKAPEDGSCLDGKIKYKYYGIDWGFPFDRCVCIDRKDSPLYSVDNTECIQGLTQCPSLLPLFKDELIGDVFKRYGTTFRNKVVTDGCCPKDVIKWIFSSVYTGLEKNLCACGTNEAGRNYQQGVPKVSSNESSSEEK
jgi:hypothetical protein